MITSDTLLAAARILSQPAGRIATALEQGSQNLGSIALGLNLIAQEMRKAGEHQRAYGHIAPK